MKRYSKVPGIVFILFICCFIQLDLNSQNPVILDQFTADPTARVFEGKIFVYPSHDIPCEVGQGFIGFCMADYHVFSSENLTEWKDNGVILTQEDVKWVDSESYSMWAPDCIYKEGRYYFYFPAIQEGKAYRESRTIGVAVSDSPTGPFIPEDEPIRGVLGIDPNLFIDEMGGVYLYWASNDELYMAKLKENMKELSSKPVMIAGLPEGFKEGPFMFEREGIFYLTYPYVPETTERLVYATGDNPLGPFTYQGVIMRESPIKCWTNHHSIVQYEGQWYLFYHHNDLSPEFDKNRSMRIDSLFFYSDGSIAEVVPSLRGVGLTKAGSRIEIDRYSRISQCGDTIDFINPENRSEGWKVILSGENSWLQYNAVDFMEGKFKRAFLKAKADEDAMLEIRLGDKNGTLISSFPVNSESQWKVFESELLNKPIGVQNIFILVLKGNNVEVDWLKFQ